MFDDFDLGPQCEEFFDDFNSDYWDSLETPVNVDDDAYWDSLDTMLGFDVGTGEEE